VRPSHTIVATSRLGCTRGARLNAIPLESSRRICPDTEPVRHRLLDLALIEAIRSDVACDWHGVDQGRWTRLVADAIVNS
jgi:hypothetical protein